MLFKLPYYTRKDRLIILILLPPVVLLINYWVFGKRYFTESKLFTVASLMSGLTGFISWRLQILVAVRMHRRYPRYSQTFRRIVLSLLLYIIITVSTLCLIFVLYDYIRFFKYSLDVWHLLWAVAVVIVLDVLAASFHEGAAFYEKWKKVADEAEQLKKENLQSQLESLKSQVNPHFLFNSINSISSLLHEDIGKAERFLDEMSKVYRYLLRNNEDNLTSLSTELQFIQSYYHLLNTRYGDSLVLQTKIDDRYLGYQLPPLTLQMLVENAVKHNTMMKHQPLRILIATGANNNLIVSNNLQRKIGTVASNKVGLSNIAKKYQLLKQRQIIVEERAGEFYVNIPLIA
jgi:two-component system, LytTR family, sensor kinase